MPITTPGGNTFDDNGVPINPPTETTTTPGVNQSGAGGFLQTAGQFLTGSNNPFTNASVIPAELTAAKQWYDAGQYRQLGNQAADRADPFGQYRRGYGDQLAALYKDPSQIANTPGYKFALNQALDATQGRLSSMGYGGTGTMADSLSAQASGLAQQTWNTEANRLAMMAGAQFDPANAARMQMEGGQLAVNSQNAALAAMMYPFGPGAANGTTINNNNGGGGGQNGHGGSNIQSRLQQAVSSGKISGADAASLYQRILNSQGNISDADLNLMNSLGIDTNVDTGGMDMAPPSYDINNGFGGSPNIDPSTGAIIDTSLNPNTSPFNIDDGSGGYWPTNTDSIDTTGFITDPWS